MHEYDLLAVFNRVQVHISDAIVGVRQLRQLKVVSRKQCERLHAQRQVSG